MQRVGKSAFVSQTARKGYLFFGSLIVLSIVVLVLFSYHSGAFGVPLEFSGNTIIVKKGGDFQAALDRAKPGDTILLEAGATFKGAFKLPNKSGGEFITVRSSAAESQLPAVNERIDPAKYSALLPKLESNVRGEPVILAANGAHHFRFVAIEFTPTIEGLYDIIQIGTSAEKKIEELPHHIEFDRVYIHGSPKYGQRRGIAANGKFIRIENSYISEIKRKGDESQAIAIWATDGPVHIINNYLEAAAENILFGGAAPILPLVPTDCVVYGNYLNKPTEWIGTGWVVKNLFEIKSGKRIKIENNLMTNNWGMGQDGMAVLFTTRTDSGAATVIEDIVFSGNIVRGAGGGINVWGGEGGGGRNLVIRNNIFDDLTGHKWNSGGRFMKSSEWDGLTIENNTIIQTGHITVAYDKPVKNFVFRNNIVFHNEYGFFGDELGDWPTAIDRYFPGGIVNTNIIIGGNSNRYREKNFFLTSINQVGFVNAAQGDYRLRNESPYKDKGFGGKNIGADLDPKAVGSRGSKALSVSEQ
jgi:hypothetical protein